MEQQNCIRCVYLHETCIKTGRYKDKNKKCDCGQFKSVTPNWDSLEKLYNIK